MKTKTPSLALASTFATLLFVVGFAASGAAKPLASSPACGVDAFDAYFNGPAKCNCTSSAQSLAVTHCDNEGGLVGCGSMKKVSDDSSVDTQNPNNPVTLETGTETSSIPPNKCHYFRYLFECCPDSASGGFSCTIKSTSLRERDPEDGEC